MFYCNGKISRIISPQKRQYFGWVALILHGFVMYKYILLNMEKNDHLIFTPIFTSLFLLVIIMMCALTFKDPGYILPKYDCVEELIIENNESEIYVCNNGDRFYKSWCVRC